jgi:hypothetical protein
LRAAAQLAVASLYWIPEPIYRYRRAECELKMPVTYFLRLNGVPATEAPPAGEVVYLLDPMGAWRPREGDRLYDIEAECVSLHDALASKIFGNIQIYHALLPRVIKLVNEAGLNSEAAISRDTFQRFVQQNAGMLELNKLLYLYDCRKLVSGIQECTKEVCYLVGEFYRSLNLDELFYPPGVEPDGLRWISSPATTKLIAVLHVIFIRLHSLLDYTTKLVFEAEHLRSDFTNYPRQSSSNPTSAVSI